MFKSGVWLGQEIYFSLISLCGIGRASCSAENVRRYAIRNAPDFTQVTYRNHFTIELLRSSGMSCFVLSHSVCMRLAWLWSERDSFFFALFQSILPTSQLSPDLTSMGSESLHTYLFPLSTSLLVTCTNCFLIFLMLCKTQTNHLTG